MVDALFLAVGCAGSDVPVEPSYAGAERQVALTIRGFYRALARGDAPGVCRRITPEARVKRAASADSTRCQDSVDPSGEVYAEPVVHEVEVDGSDATAVVSEIGGVVQRFYLVRLDGRWRSPTLMPLASAGPDALRCAPHCAPRAPRIGKP